MSWRHIPPAALIEMQQRRHQTILAKSEAKFWTKTDRSDPEGCWVWTGARQSRPGRTTPGYGHILRFRKVVYAHRHALELSLGRPLGPGMRALHRCDNPPCINPAHLFEGTAADNTADMVAKGRSTRLLTADQVIEARAAYAKGDVTTKALSRRFGLSHPCMTRLLRGLSYAEIPGAVPIRDTRRAA